MTTVRGSSVGLIAAVGLGIAVIGSVLMVSAWRRRAGIVPPTD
jgi:hypothetical protein